MQPSNKGHKIMLWTKQILSSNHLIKLVKCQDLRLTTSNRGWDITTHNRGRNIDRGLGLTTYPIFLLLVNSSFLSFVNLQIINKPYEDLLCYELNDYRDHK